MRATLMCSVFILYLFLYFYSVNLWTDYRIEDDFITDRNTKSMSYVRIIIYSLALKTFEL